MSGSDSVKTANIDNTDRWVLLAM